MKLTLLTKDSLAVGTVLEWPYPLIAVTEIALLAV